MKPRPAEGTKATPWLRFCPGMSATTAPVVAFKTSVWVERGT
ncbi:MAG TPA: hypothetical protein VGM73_16555 [Candidatus Didemnitutus sp.]